MQGLLRAGSDGTRTRDLRRDRSALKFSTELRPLRAIGAAQYGTGVREAKRAPTVPAVLTPSQRRNSAPRAGFPRRQPPARRWGPASHCRKRLWTAPAIATAITLAAAGSAYALVSSGGAGMGWTGIVGSNQEDTINALGGPDRVFALAGADKIDAGAGDDRVKAGAGDDEVAAGDGNDHARGQPWRRHDRRRERLRPRPCRARQRHRARRRGLRRPARRHRSRQRFRRAGERPRVRLGAPRRRQRQRRRGRRPPLHPRKKKSTVKIEPASTACASISTTSWRPTASAFARGGALAGRSARMYIGLRRGNHHDPAAGHLRYLTSLRERLAVGHSVLSRPAIRKASGGWSDNEDDQQQDDDDCRA